MKKVHIGINNIGNIQLRMNGDKLRIDDANNDGVIECTVGNLRKTIRFIKEAYKNRHDPNLTPYGYGHKTIQLSHAQSLRGLDIFRANYIIMDNMPDIIKMLESVDIEKDKYILHKDKLLGLGIDELVYLKQTMKRRKKVFTDDNGCKYIEV